MKKGIIITVCTLIVLVFAGLFFFFGFPKFSNKAVTETSQNPAPVELKSFRGVLADVLRDVAAEASEIKEDISEAVTSPFTDNKTPGTTEVPADNSFTFAILGDTQYFTAGNPKGNFQKAVANIQKQNPDLVVAVGDLISNCKGKSEDTRDYNNWKNVLGSLISKTYTVQGNHDRVENEDKCDRIWTDAFNFPTNGPNGFAEFTYSLDFKNSHFVFLDSNKPDAHKINDTQRAWLEQDLAKNKKENTFVIFHEPAHPVSDKAKESLDVHPAERNALWKILEKYNVTAVFNGHEHIVSRRKIGKIYQFVFGSTDSFNHGLPAAGVAEYANQGQGRSGIVKVKGKEITVETYDPNGKLLNTFTHAPESPGH